MSMRGVMTFPVFIGRVGISTKHTVVIWNVHARSEVETRLGKIRKAARAKSEMTSSRGLVMLLLMGTVMIIRGVLIVGK